jgi:hypothetical protein
VVWTNNAISTAAREATRFAVVHGSNAECAVGPHSADQDYPVLPSADCPHPSDEVQAIKDEAERWMSGAGGDVTISVCYGVVTDCTSDQNTATNARGTPVTVAIKVRIGLSAPALLGIGNLTLSASNTSLVNH